MGYYWNDHMNNTNWWPFMVLMMLIVFAALFVALFALLRHRPVHHLGAAAPRSSAVAILQERFARGELNEDEYRLRLKMLRDSPPE